MLSWLSLEEKYAATLTKKQNVSYLSTVASFAFPTKQMKNNTKKAVFKSVFALFFPSRKKKQFWKRLKKKAMLFLSVGKNSQTHDYSVESSPEVNM
jgi:hypothetical protein